MATRKAVVQVVSDILRLNAQWNEVLKRVGNGSLEAKLVRQALQRLIQTKPNRFARYDHWLLPVEDQIARLRRYNGLYWGNSLPEEQFIAANVPSDHVQRLDDLEVLHVSFGSPELDVEMWWRVFVGEHGKTWRQEEITLDRAHFSVMERRTRRYEPGIHRVRVNLVAHWDPSVSRYLRAGRDEAIDGGEILAHSEVFSAYGLHPELLRQQDGENLPYSTAPGFTVKIPHDPVTFFLCVCLTRPALEVALCTEWSAHESHEWSVPVILQ